MAQAKRFERPTSIVMMDIDHFKAVNDQYGHYCGDLALQSIARCLQGAVREADIVARLGGEEFAIVLVETAVEEAAVIVERIRQSIEQLAVECNGEMIQITASFGVTACQCGEVHLEQLLKRADAALYRAKENGRNRVEVEG